MRPVDRVQASAWFAGWESRGPASRAPRQGSNMPVTLTSNGDNFLVDAQNNGTNSVSLDLPNTDIASCSQVLFLMDIS